MHISDGILSAPVLVGGAVLAVAGVACGLRRMPWDQVMPVSMLAAAFFVASLIHIPIGAGVSAHLILNGLMGAILGWAALPAIAVALFLQAVLFQFGGLTVLGVNICVMGLPAVLFGLCLRPFLRGPRLGAIAAFACGALSAAGSGILCAAALTLSGDVFFTTAMAILSVHVPVMIVEGIITTVMVRFLAKALPELLSPRGEGAAGTPGGREP